MDIEMGRLILVPQYPTRLRYQEWWFSEFPNNFINYFDEVISLGTYSKSGYLTTMDSSKFAPINEALEFELYQISSLSTFNFKDDDVLLLNDLSYPGLFTQALFHNRPKKCFAICHATSRNAYDYFAKDRQLKYPIEKTTAKLFKHIFVGSNYHANKLGWKNIIVTGLPKPPFSSSVHKQEKRFPIISVARDTMQKRTKEIEEEVKRAFHCKIFNPKPTDWASYYDALSYSKVLLITAKEETYGYQIVDAIMNDCIPVAPNHFSYPELIPKNYLYNSINELIAILIKALGGELPVPQLLTEKRSLTFYEDLAKYMQQ
jgi:hypothetical protein